MSERPCAQPEGCCLSYLTEGKGLLSLAASEEQHTRWTQDLVLD